jgi:signal transduction histidine kinase
MDAGTLLRDAQAEVSVMYPASRIEIDIDGDLHGNWDDERLAQAMTNLLSNAVQHGIAGGTVCITARGLPKEVVISVANRGPVISPEEVSQLFKPMKKSENMRRADDQHLGLGLYIVEKIVEAHGGSISVESTEAAGTVFTIRLGRD